jgi:signal transduction histidine kinase
MRWSLNELQVVASSGKHLLGLINDILEVSKIEAGKLEIHANVSSIKEACESSLNFIRELAIKKSITLDFWNTPGVATLYADPQRLKQMLINLLNNVVKFTPEKET